MARLCIFTSSIFSTQIIPKLHLNSLLLKKGVQYVMKKNGHITIDSKIYPIYFNYRNNIHVSEQCLYKNITLQ